jgi:hypothetical protein
MSGDGMRPGTDLGHGVTPGDNHYRAFIGPPQNYDVFAHMQFSLMTLLGLREHHKLLDIGCGSLRPGKLFIMYLLAGGYRGIEPEKWLVDEGIEREIGAELLERKQPRFAHARDFPCASFGEQFDFVLAHSIFSHASVQQVRQCFANVRSTMKATSIFAASFLEGESDYAGDDWVYPGCVRFRAETIERLAREAGLSSRRLDWFHVGGQAWFVFFLPGLDPQVDLLASLNQSLPIKVEMLHYRARSDALERLESNVLFRLATRLARLVRPKR